MHLVQLIILDPFMLNTVVKISWYEHSNYNDPVFCPLNNSVNFSWPMKKEVMKTDFSTFFFNGFIDFIGCIGI